MFWFFKRLETWKKVLVIKFQKLRTAAIEFEKYSPWCLKLCIIRYLEYSTTKLFLLCLQLLLSLGFSFSKNRSVYVLVLWCSFFIRIDTLTYIFLHTCVFMIPIFHNRLPFSSNIFLSKLLLGFFYRIFSSTRGTNPYHSGFTLRFIYSYSTCSS